MIDIIGEHMFALAEEDCNLRWDSKIKTLPKWYGKTEKVLLSSWEKTGVVMSTNVQVYVRTRKDPTYKMT
jgi:hypothetical protein